MEERIGIAARPLLPHGELSVVDLPVFMSRERPPPSPPHHSERDSRRPALLRRSEHAYYSHQRSSQQQQSSSCRFQQLTYEVLVSRASSSQLIPTNHIHRSVRGVRGPELTARSPRRRSRSRWRSSGHPTQSSSATHSWSRATCPGRGHGCSTLGLGEGGYKARRVARGADNPDGPDGDDGVGVSARRVWLCAGGACAARQAREAPTSGQG